MIRLILLISFFLCVLNNSYGNIDSTLIDSSKALNNKGIDYLYSGDFYMAEKYFMASLKLKEEIFHNQANINIANAYNNIGVLNMRKWEFDSSLIFFNKAEEIYSQFNNTELFISIIYSNQGNIYRYKGDFALGEQYYNKALRSLEALHTEKAEQRITEVLIRLGLLEIEQQNFQKSVEIFENAVNTYNDKSDAITLIDLFYNLGNAYMLNNQYSESKKAFQYSIELTRNSPEISKRMEARAIQKLSVLLSKSGENDEALKLIDKSFNILKSLEIDSIYYYDLYSNYAEINQRIGKYKIACQAIQSAITITCNYKLKGIYDNPTADSFGNIFLGISQLRAKAECLIKWNSAEPNDTLILSALDALETATKLIDISRNSYLSLESKLLLAENETSVYNTGIICSFNLYNKTNNPEYLNKAFYFAEKNKSSVLSSVLQEEKAKSFSNIPEELLEKEKSLKREITFYKERIYEESLKLNPDSIKLTTWNNYLFEYTREQDELRNQLEDNYPDYYTLKYNQQTPNIKDIQELIDRKTSIVEYTMTDSLLYVFLINKRNSSMYEVKIDSAFLSKTIKYLTYFRDFSFMNQGNNVYSDFESASYEIYNTLIAPLGNNHKCNNLIIIPDDILSYIPFEALIKSNGSDLTSSYSNLDFLINHYAISYSYSASLLHDSWTNKHRKIQNKLLAISPTYNPESTDGIVQNQFTQKIRFRDKLQPIPYAMDEAKLVSIITKGEKIIGENATEENFTSRAGGFDILHLAMHTIIDDNNPLYSKLVFYDENYSDENGLLTTNEIFGLKLNAKMTVLSSCSSGEGEIKKGEGVLSLARGFFYAGCPSLVMTLWKVEDKSGLILMQNYYKYLIKGYSKPVALQKSKLDYINAVPNEKRHPFYWSAYICIGNPSPIYYPRAIVYSLIGIVVIASIFVLIKFRKKKTSVLSEPNL